VPDEVALSSSREVLDSYASGGGAVSGSIIWCEFKSNGRFTRAGISDVGLMESRSILSSSDHPAISEITTYAKDHGIQAGHIVPSSNGEGFHWCIPYTPQTRARRPEHGLRTLLITESLFLEVFDLFNIEDQLTPSEKHFVYQLVTGLSPAQAAKLDGVSVETKRSHLKRAMSKLGCSTQSDVVRMMFSQMIHVLYLCEAETAQNRVIETFTMQHLGEGVRLSSHRLPSGQLQRVWEMGPLGLRLVIPVRSGYLDEQTHTETLHEGRLIDQTVEDLEAFIRMTWNGPIEVLCHATGAYYAMLLSQKSPDLFSRMVITSINLMGDDANKTAPSAKFLGGIRKLAKHSGMYETLVRQFQKTTFSNGHATRFVLRRLFRESTFDLDALNGVVGHGPAFDWYQALHASSMVGIASDRK